MINLDLREVILPHWIISSLVSEDIRSIKPIKKLGFLESIPDPSKIEIESDIIHVHDCYINTSNSLAMMISTTNSWSKKPNHEKETFGYDHKPLIISAIKNTHILSLVLADEDYTPYMYISMDNRLNQEDTLTISMPIAVDF